MAFYRFSSSGTRFHEHMIGPQRGARKAAPIQCPKSCPKSSPKSCPKSCPKSLLIAIRGENWLGQCGARKGGQQVFRSSFGDSLGDSFDDSLGDSRGGFCDHLCGGLLGSLLLGSFKAILREFCVSLLSQSERFLIVRIQCAGPR